MSTHILSGIGIEVENPAKQYISIVIFLMGGCYARHVKSCRTSFLEERGCVLPRCVGFLLAALIRKGGMNRPTLSRL